ncbi:MAG: hypothetical protein UFA98_03815, partial [Ruminococcus sp.]|nr:hypothetical protein [Ruminococcus sp.]
SIIRTGRGGKGDGVILIPDRKYTYILRGYFSQDKAEDAARLAPCKDDNEGRQRSIVENRPQRLATFY